MRRTGLGAQVGSMALTAALALLSGLGTWACNQPTRTAAPSADALPAVSPVSLPPGPDLGEAWTTEPDPDAFINIPGESAVAPDQYLVMLGRSSTEAQADAVAASIGGSVGGHIAYIGMWKVLTPPAGAVDEYLARLDTLAGQEGVLAAAPVALAVTQSGCSTALDDPVYAGEYSAPYDMIGVRAAWDIFYASGLPVGTVHVGMLDSLLTRDPKGRISWEFDDLTFIGDPLTTPDPHYASLDSFNHADGVLGILAGSGQNGGIAGVGSVLGSKLLVSQDVTNAPDSKGQPSKWTARDGDTYTDAELLKTIREIESGATIINGSWGGEGVISSPERAATVAMWKAFFDQMAVDHPNVLFVYAAGNYNTQLDGTNYFPGGIPSPNVITVGNVNTDGGKHTDDDDGSDSVMPDSGAEITLGAPGDRAVWGIGLDAQVQNTRGGTSSATPMVTATAALIRSVDPTLSAAQIKDMIAATTEQGDPEVGGGSLRVDLALRRAVDGARARRIPPLPELTDEQIASAGRYCQIDVSVLPANGSGLPAGASRWEVRASVAEATGKPDLSLLVGGAKPGNWRQSVAPGGAPAKWSVAVAAGGASGIVTRHDNGFWVKVAIGDGVQPSPAPTAVQTAIPGPTPTPTPTPSPTMAAGPTFDCSNMPEYGTIAYAQWALKCKPIAP